MVQYQTVEPEICPDRVAIYIRWSTDDQSDGTTLDVQLEGCKHYALSQGWQFNPDLLFIDDGYSGGTMDRPAMGHLRQAVKDGRVDCVVVFKIDRLSRNVVDTVNLVLREWEGLCHVKSARESIDTATQQGKMFFYTLVSFAEWERSVIKERTWSGRMKRLQEGKNPGFRPPYGLQTGPTPGTFAPVPAEAAVVERIYHLYTRGMGYKNIAVLLTEGGIRSRGGRPFTAQAIKDILANPLYAGRLVWGRVRRTRSGSKVRSADSQVTAVESPNLPRLIDEETFRLAQATRAERAEQRVPSRAVSSDHLLTGIARCKRCGSALMAKKKYPAAGRPGVEQTPYYVCSGQRNKGKAFCSAGYIRQADLDRWITERLLARFAGPVDLDRYLQAPSDSARREADAARESLDGVRRELEGLQRELEVLGRDYRRERLTVEEYNEQKAQVARERTRLLTRAEQLEESIRAADQRLVLLRNRVGRIDLVRRWDELPLTERKHLLRELIHHLTVFRDPATRQVEFELVWVSDGTE